jgi:hypothetical protein
MIAAIREQVGRLIEGAGPNLYEVVEMSRGGGGGPGGGGVSRAPADRLRSRERVSASLASGSCTWTIPPSPHAMPLAVRVLSYYVAIAPNIPEPPSGTSRSIWPCAISASARAGYGSCPPMTRAECAPPS